MTDITYENQGRTAALPAAGVYVRVSDGEILCYTTRHGFARLDPAQLAAALAQVPGLTAFRAALAE